MFKCLRCGACCRDLIIKFGQWHLGLFLMANEAKLFPSGMVSPMWSVGSEDNVRVYQLNVKDCPHLTDRNTCQIYQSRPLICRAYPLSVHADPTTNRITAASVDAKCKGCTDVPKEGTYQKLSIIFTKEILYANAKMTYHLSKIFSGSSGNIWLYDVTEKRWKKITKEVANQLAFL